MTVPIPDLPGHDTPNWDTTWAVGINAKLADLESRLAAAETTIASLTAPTGLVLSVNGITPTAGDVTLGAADVGAMSSGYSPGFGDLPIGSDITVDKDSTAGSPTLGFWPTGYNADGSPIYTGGSASHGTRPHARRSKVVWRGADPPPDSVTSGTAGMLRGVDERATPVS